VYKFLVGKHEVKSPVGRCRCRWENKIKRSLGNSEQGCASDLCGPLQGPFVGSVLSASQQ
jgi:hypothetical protein